MTAARASQNVGEVLGETTPAARATQTVAEPLGMTNPVARATQTVEEVLGFVPPKAFVSQIVIETLVVNLESPMPPVYPVLPGLTYNVEWVPQFFNMPTETTATGADIDLGLAEYPLHDFHLKYSFFRDYVASAYGDTEFRTFMAFFLQLRGTIGRFLFDNPDDDHVTAQEEFTTDGTNSTFGPLIRTFGAGTYSASEPVGVVNTVAIFNLYLDGVLQSPTTYDVLTSDPCNQQIHFHSTPAAGKVCTVDMHYYYYCKFPDNSNTFVKFMNQLWLVDKVTLHSCRAGA